MGEGDRATAAIAEAGAGLALSLALCRAKGRLRQRARLAALPFLSLGSRWRGAASARPAPRAGEATMPWPAWRWWSWWARERSADLGLATDPPAEGGGAPRAAARSGVVTPSRAPLAWGGRPRLAKAGAVLEPASPGGDASTWGRRMPGAQPAVSMPGLGGLNRGPAERGCETPDSDVGFSPPGPVVAAMICRRAAGARRSLRSGPIWRSVGALLARGDPPGSLSQAAVLATGATSTGEPRYGPDGGPRQVPAPVSFSPPRPQATERAARGSADGPVASVDGPPPEELPFARQVFHGGTASEASPGAPTAVPAAFEQLVRRQVREEITRRQSPAPVSFSPSRPQGTERAARGPADGVVASVDDGPPPEELPFARQVSYGGTASEASPGAPAAVPAAVEQLVRRQVREEITRRQSRSTVSIAPPSRASGRAGVDLAGEDGIRLLTRKISQLARAERFRMGRLR